MPYINKKTQLFCYALLLSPNCYAEDENSAEDTNVYSIEKLIAMPLEKLLEIPVTTPNKKPQSVKDSAAAVFVISQEDIRRSGVTTIPDALRMAPGVEVTQIDANKWEVSARGFNDRFSNKLLVMVDGRSVYTPFTSGVFWHREDTPLEDVERIEVIRGVGATMWGANAMNGVINIITKSAKDTHGALITAGSGNQQQAFGSLRYGGKVGDDFHYRLYGKGFKRNNNNYVNHENAQDDWENYQGGFKTEWQLGTQDSLTTQGDIYYSRTGDKEDFALPYPPFVLKGQDSPAHYSGGNIQTRWKHKISETSETALQVYYKEDNTNWTLVTPFKMQEKVADIDFQHRFNWAEQHNIIWGLGYRYFGFDSKQSVKMSFNPASRNLQLFSAFLQDDITLLKDELKLTIGTRLEHNDFTGVEVQPNIRLLWTPDNKQSVWGAISRAVRTPSLTTHNMENFRGTVPASLNLPLPALSSLKGNPQFKSETVMDYELGYRIQPMPELSFDVTAFYNNYDRLYTGEILAPNVVLTSSSPYIEIPVQYVNKLKGETLGVELTTQWQPTDWLKMQASYWYLKLNLQRPKDFSVLAPDDKAFEGNTPQQQFRFKSSLNLPYHFEFDTMLRYVDSVPARQIDGYVAVDMRLGWKPLKYMEFSVVGQNLFDKLHSESKDYSFEIPQTEIRRSVFGKLSLSF